MHHRGAEGTEGKERFTTKARRTQRGTKSFCWLNMHHGGTESTEEEEKVHHKDTKNTKNHEERYWASLRVPAVLAITHTPSLRAAMALLLLKAPVRWTPPTVIPGIAPSAARQSREPERNARGRRDCV